MSVMLCIKCPFPYSVLRTQYSVLRVLHSALRTPHSALLAALLTLNLLSTSHSQEKTTHLPWEPPPRTAEPLLRLPAGPAEILERFDIGPAQLESVSSGHPLSPAEEDVLIKILYRLPRLGLDNLLRWRQRGITWDQLAAVPADHRAQVFHLTGRVKRVEKTPISPQQAELYEFNHYFRVTLALDGSPYEALVAARRVPAAWPIDAPLDERAAADALFLKLVGQASSLPGKVGQASSLPDKPQLLFAAGAISWHPDRADPAHHIGPPQLALANLGMDVSLWDDIRDSKQHALTAADREGFYQLLAALGRPEALQLRPASKDQLDVVPLLKKPAEHFGQILPVEGVARRIIKVSVNDADIRSRFGIDHYYEIDLFVPLSGAKLRFGNDPTGENSPVYRNAFPATLIVRELPPGLQEGENVHEQVRADGVFFKTWAYRSNYTSRFGQLQPAPLFLAANPRVVPLVTTTNWVTATLIIAALTLALAVTGIITWFYARSDRAAAKSTAKQKSNTQPDFSHLR